MRRIPELDALRGLAAVTIVAFHLWFPTHGFLGTGVNLFFVISGYLITSIILKQRGEPGFLISFYARRSLRIFPIYYLSLAVILAVNPVLPKPYPTEGLAYFMTYTQNLPQYWGAEHPPFMHGFSHTWSLAVEEQYYLIWPLALVLSGKRSPIPLAIALMSLAIGTRMAGFSKWITMTNLDGLALGGVLAAIFDPAFRGRMSEKGIRYLLLGVGAGSIVFLAKGNSWCSTLGGTWTALGNPAVALSLRLFAINLAYFSLIGLVVVYTGHRLLAPLRDNRLAFVGQMSYGIYLYHYFLFDIVQDYADQFGVTNRFAIDAVKVSLSFAAAFASWRLIEQPILALKDHFSYRSRPFLEKRPNSEPAGLEPLRSGAR